MEILSNYSSVALAHAQSGATYNAEVVTAVAAFATLFAVLSMVCAVVYATFWILRVVFRGAAVYLTFAAVLFVVIVGWLNR